MGKLVITGMSDGVIRFVEGSETTISVNEIKARLEAINSNIDQFNQKYAFADRDLRAQAETAISAKETETQEAKARLDQELCDFKASIEAKLEEDLDRLKANKEAEEPAILGYQEEKKKYETILSNLHEVHFEEKAGVINEVAAAEAQAPAHVEQVVEEPKVAQAEPEVGKAVEMTTKRRIIF